MRIPTAAPAIGVWALVAAVSLAAGGDAAGTGQPPPIVATGPAPAYSVGSAYDAARQRLVLFGGYVKGAYVGDTWEWDGTTWHHAGSNGPTARNSPALVYDAARHQTVLFGGDTRSTGALGDTWIYDGTAWREIATPGPPARTTHQMVYDARRQRVVLFGGSAGTTMFGDTWEWDSRQWIRLASDGPAARTLYGLAYDAKRHVVVLFGGTSVIASDAPSYGDTWEWNGSAWRQSTASGPSARDHVAMGYDAARHLTILHGGGTGPEAPAETWAYDWQAMDAPDGLGAAASIRPTRVRPPRPVDAAVRRLRSRAVERAVAAARRSLDPRPARGARTGVRYSLNSRASSTHSPFGARRR